MLESVSGGAAFVPSVQVGFPFAEGLLILVDDVRYGLLAMRRVVSTVSAPGRRLFAVATQ